MPLTKPLRAQALPRLKARRMEICLTAAHTFVERGFDATSVNDIAAAIAALRHHHAWSRFDRRRGDRADARDCRPGGTFSRHRAPSRGDSTVAAYAILGMIIWIPRWFRPRRRRAKEVASDVAAIALNALFATRK